MSVTQLLMKTQSSLRHTVQIWMWSYVSLKVISSWVWIHGADNASYDLHRVDIKERLIVLKRPE